MTHVFHLPVVGQLPLPDGLLNNFAKVIFFIYNKRCNYNGESSTLFIIMPPPNRVLRNTLGAEPSGHITTILDIILTIP